MSAGLACTNCRAPLVAPEFFNHSEASACPQCGALLQVLVFPAFFREVPRSPSGEPLLTESEASCFFHPHKKAVVPCSICGRFLCGLCDFELNGEHVCPGCLERGQQKRTLAALEKRCVRYDSIALALALIPLLIWPLTILTAPAALYMTLRHWKFTGSIVGSSKVQFLFALLFSILEIAGWAIGLYFAFTR